MAKTIEEIMNAYAESRGFNSIDAMFEEGCVTKLAIRNIAKEFANSKLEQAAECATTYDANEGKCGGMLPPCHFVDKQYILNLREEI